MGITLQGGRGKMLEVCFSDSVKGALAVAQNCATPSIGGAVGFLTDKNVVFSFFTKRKALKEYRKKQLALQKQAVSLGGRKQDIAGLSLGLSEGDIKAPLCFEDCPRKEYIRALFCFDRHNEQEDMETSIAEFWANCIDDLEKLKANPQKIRIWLDETPDAQCGLLFIADLLKGSEIEIHIVELPHKIKREDNCMVEYRGWGEVEPQRYGTFLEQEKVLTPKEVVALANRWKLLQSENAPLRVVKDGAVSSAEISYYDDQIRKEFPQNSCRIAYLIGSALGKQKIPTGDVFIAKRIQHFIDTGELKVLGKPDAGFYSTIVKCVKLK